MSSLDFTIVDLDFPVGNKNKTATLITGDRDAVLVDAGFTRADGHRLVATVLDCGRRLTTVVVSHGDPDYYFGAEVVADAFPDAVFVATPPVIEHIAQSFAGKLEAWSSLGVNLPTRTVALRALVGGVDLEGHRFVLRGGPEGLPDRHYLWQPEQRALVGGVSVFAQEHVWTADTPTRHQRAVWIAELENMAALDPSIVVPGHRLPGAAADRSAIAATRDYLLAFEQELDAAKTSEQLIAAMTARYPDYGLTVSLEIGAKVALGEMSWS